MARCRAYQPRTAAGARDMGGSGTAGEWPLQYAPIFYNCSISGIVGLGIVGHLHPSLALRACERRPADLPGQAGSDRLPGSGMRIALGGGQRGMADNDVFCHIYVL